MLRQWKSGDYREARRTLNSFNAATEEGGVRKAGMAALLESALVVFEQLEAVTVPMDPPAGGKDRQGRKFSRVVRGRKGDCLCRMRERAL